MNFDFTQQEQKLFKDINDAMLEMAGERTLEEKDPGNAGKTVREALIRLEKTSYLKLGTVQDKDIPGLCAMMGAMEIVSSFSQSLYLSVEMSTRLFGRIISTFGNKEQKNKWLSPVLGGKKLGAVALSEKSMNIDNDPMATTGVRENAVIKISGTKNYVINGLTADFTAVAGTIESKPAIFIVEKEATGLIPGKPLVTMGYDGLSVSGLTLDECRIKECDVIGPFEDNSAFNTLKMWENQILVGGSLGMMKASFESAKTYAKTHRTGGKPIIAYQEVAFKLAEMLTLLQTSQLFAYRVAWAAEAKNRESEVLTCCAKVFCTEAAERVSGSALQILSGEGYLSGNAAERAYRCAKYGQIAGTSTEIARVKIGNAALGA
ncbi:MAG: acyl-CoA dehydrogenase [Desulfobacteraceae bacterium]|nr:MAG: acyl-CoA dehydrogenase [Desulfobacteraceae bacterium]